MYSDIIPPKKKYTKIRNEEYNSVRFSSPHPIYTETSGTKKPIMLLLAACVVVGLFAYHNLSHATKFTITPEVTHFNIVQNIPLVLQGREDKSLTYSLVYVPTTEEGFSRNPFTTAEVATSTPTESVSASASRGTTITASTTGDAKRITIINTTGSSVPLRKETRFDVGGVVYTLDTANANNPTDKKIIDIAKRTASSSIYRVIGFKGYPTYDSIYAVPEIVVTKDTVQKLVATSTAVSAATGAQNIVVSAASSTVPPKEILSLMPSGTLALQKSTIYDKGIGQSALVVFEQSAMEQFLREHVAQTQEYYKALKPYGESISYEITILDYTLQTSPETGKPVSFSSLQVEISPKVDTKSVTLQFAGFSKDTMNIIEKQVAPFVRLQTAYTPFWSKTVAKPEKIHIDLK